MYLISKLEQSMAIGKNPCPISRPFIRDRGNYFVFKLSCDQTMSLVTLNIVSVIQIR